MKYLFILMVSILFFSCEQKTTLSKKITTIDSLSVKKEITTKLNSKTDSALVTFIEIGSVRCIPCKKMQKVIKSIEEKYGNSVKTIFYDVWTPEGKPFAAIYNINLIPTQIFLDSEGKEYYRHEGFFPEEELVKILNQKGVQ